MDPDTALAAARQAITDYRQLSGTNPEAAARAAAALAENFLALDEWMSFGGFAPAAWKGRPRS